MLRLGGDDLSGGLPNASVFSRREHRPMSQDRSTMTIHIEPGSQPIAGWLQVNGAARREFEGMIELIQLLETARSSRHSPPGGSRHENPLPGGSA